MAARFVEEEPRRLECENCGATSDLLRCSRCHAAWFCSLKCHKAYWPFHRAACRPNQFADAVEGSEPKFAAWMRGHGRLAVLKDDEVDRLERASKPGGCWGLSRAEVLDGMYGRIDPKPRPPEYDGRERAAMREAEEAALIARQTQLVVRSAAAAAAAAAGGGGGGAAGAEAADAWERLAGGGGGGGGGGSPWDEIVIPEGMGLEVSSRLKWRQTQTHVEVFVRLPAPLLAQLAAGRSIKGKVRVEVGPDALAVALAGGDDAVVRGRLFAGVKADASTWFIDDGMVSLRLLKRCRRGHYADGATNADTWWRSLLAGAGAGEALAGRHPPADYYSSPYEEE
ncbi:MAG: hypothetical protein J3K34DRAFT_453232 [Monoraphidium minutum]|nr:MAG: hypothetical protein J3K34DRAFT_453232 [Monoraphidium minutum]